MKEISIVCNVDGTAKISSSSITIDNENNASKLIIDFSAVPSCVGLDKWVDIVLSNDTSLRYDLGIGVIVGSEDIVELDLGNALTISGYAIITPFALDTVNDIKIKFKPDEKLKIIYQAETGEDAVAVRDDYIVALKVSVDKFEFYTETEFEDVTREAEKVYGVYSEITGVIIWYYGIIGV